MASIAPSKWSMDGNSKLFSIVTRAFRFYHVLSLPIIACYALSLCGCISSKPQIPDIFLAELIDTSSTSTARTRFAYFGVCVTNNNGPFKCASSRLSSSTHLASSLSTTTSLMTYTLSLQQSISFITACLAALIFFMALLTLGVLELLVFLRKRKLSIFLRKDNGMDTHILNLILATRILFWGSSAVSLASAQAIHTTLRALEHATLLSTIQIHRGATMEALVWTMFALSMVLNTAMQIITSRMSNTILRFRARKSTPLPFINTISPSDIEKQLSTPTDATRSESVRKLTTATAQRLAQVGMHNNQSQHSINSSLHPPGTPTIANDNPLSPNFQALNSPGLRPPLATLGRSKSINASKSRLATRSPSPEPSRLAGRTLSFLQHRAGAGSAMTGTMKNIETRAHAPTRPSRENDRFVPLSPELRSILKPGWNLGGASGSGSEKDRDRSSVAGSSIYSQPASGNTAVREERRGPWM